MCPSTLEGDGVHLPVSRWILPEHPFVDHGNWGFQKPSTVPSIPLLVTESVPNHWYGHRPQSRPGPSHPIASRGGHWAEPIRSLLEAVLLPSRLLSREDMESELRATMVPTLWTKLREKMKPDTEELVWGPISRHHGVGSSSFKSVNYLRTLLDPMNQCISSTVSFNGVHVTSHVLMWFTIPESLSPFLDLL